LIPHGNVDHRADIYALGVMIYQMVTGQLPAWRMEAAVGKGGCGRALGQNRLPRLQTDPSDRYASVSEIKTDISSIPLVGKERSAGTPARLASSGGAAAKNSEADKSVRAPVKSPPATLRVAMRSGRATLLMGLVAGAAALTLGVIFMMKKPVPANSEPQIAESMPAPARDASDAAVPRPHVTASSIQWQKANWTEEDLKKKTIMADGEWARIGEKAGAANGWRIGANGQTVAFKDGVVRLRYRWEEGGRIALKIRNAESYGQVVLWGPNVDLGIHMDSPARRLFQKVPLAQPLKVGDEGMLEIVAIGNRLYARLNDSIVLSSPEIPELAPSGYCAIHSENTSFRDVEYAILDGIPNPLKALGWEVPDAVEAALASVSPAVRPYVAYPERLKVPVPDWLRLASAEGGPLAIHTIGDPGPAKAALDLGEAARFDDFVFVASQATGWIAVRRNGELWARNADYSGQIKSVGPIQIRSLNTGSTCHWLEKDGTGGSLYGVHHHRFPLSDWKNGLVTDASLHSAVIFRPKGKGEGYRLAFDSAGILLAPVAEEFLPDHVLPPADWFRGAPAPFAGEGLAALTDDGKVRTWDFTTGRSFPGMDELRRVAQLAYGTQTANLGVMLSETGQATVFGPKGGITATAHENVFPPTEGGPFIRVSPGHVFAAQKTDGSWIGWNSGEPDLAAAVAGLGPVISIASGRVGLNQGIHAEKPVMVPYLIYIQPKNRSDSGFSNATPATTAPANPGTPLVKPLTWLPAVHSDGNAAKYHSETPDGWITGTPDNPGGIKVTHPAGPLGNFAVRLRYRWNKDARHLQVRVREPGRGVAGAVLFNDHWAITKYDVNSPPETRTQSLTTRKRTAKLEPGFEGMLEVAVIGDRVIARFDNTTLLDATVTGMATRGVAHISSAGLSFRDVEMASLEGIADPLKALGWEEPLNWQQATWSASEVAQKKIVVEDGWARIGQAAGALEKTWKLAVNGTPVSLGDGAVRLRYRYEGRALTLKIRNYTTYGYVTLWPSRLDLGIWSTAYAEREKRVQTRALATPLKDGEEGVLELAAAGRRLFARLNGSIVLTSEDLPDLGLTGGCEIQSDGVSFRDVEYASLHLLGGIFDPLKVLGWETEKDDSARESGTHRNSVTRTSIQWQEMAPDVSITRNTHLAKNGEWYRIVSPGGSFELLRDESAPSFKNVAVRYRIRLLEDQAPGLKLNLDTQNWEESGKIGPDGLLLQLNGSELVLIEGSRKHPAVFSPELNLKGTEADIEFAIINQVAYARINGQTIIVGPIQRKGYRNHMSLQFPAGAETRAEFSKVSEAILDGIADPLKALGWEVPDAIESDGNVWSDFFADWERSPDRNEFERTSLEHGPVGWQAARDGSGANAYLVDSQGRDLALRVTAKFDLLRNPQDSDQITVRLRRTPRGLPNEYNEYAIYLFRSGQAYLRVIDDKGSRKLITAQLPAGFDPHQFHTLEISTNGRLISFLVDGQEMGTAEDETLPPGGRFGINGSQSVVFEKAEYRFLDTPKGSPATATKETPFVNTLGMKFVPVPIGGPARSASPSDAGGGPTDGKRVLFSVWVTRVKDYAAFAKAQEAAGMKVNSTWMRTEQDGVPVGREPDHPVVSMSWDDAQAFCQWLTEKETAEGKLTPGQRYRLPTDEEWSWAVGLPSEQGSTPEEKRRNNVADIFPWGTEWPPTTKVGNYADETFHAQFPPRKNEKDGRMENGWNEGYTDGFATTSPVGSFQANAYGLYDMGGNVWEWCEDWWNADNEARVRRGSSWRYFGRADMRSSGRSNNAPTVRISDIGFRCVLETGS
jgi:formylglycine-generating enzyme required for sulfatase activity